VRFAQSQQLSQSIVAQAMQQLVAHVDTQPPFPPPYPGAEAQALVVFNPAPGPRTAPVQAEVQLPGSLHNATLVDQHGTAVPYRVLQRWRQEIGSMPIAREMLATAVTLSGITSPTQLIQMAHSMLMSTLGQSEDSFVISRIYIENISDSPLHQTPHTSLPGVTHIEIMLAPKGRVVINEEELNTAGEQVLALLQREDIHTLEVAVVDQARETIEFAALDLPEWGYKTFWLYPRGMQQSVTTHQQKLVAQTDCIENEFYRVEVDLQEASLIITDKQAGKVYRGLNRFVDGGDVGDLYTYCPPENDVLVCKPVEPARVELINAGPVRATLRVSGRWALPGACATGRSGRSSRLTICPISSEISLMSGVQRVDIHTSVDNRVKDHRLRVLFPFEIKQVMAEGTFEVHERPLPEKQSVDTTTWAEDPVGVFPQKRFVHVCDKHNSGLAVLNRGLPECEVLLGAPELAEGETAVALTLLRCVEWLSRGDLKTRRGHAGPMEHTPEAQCLGHYEFDYALIPHGGSWQDQQALVLREAQIFNTWGVTETVVADSHPGHLPASNSLLQVEPSELIVSAIKTDGNRLIIRLYNPLEQAIEATIQPGVAFGRVSMANLLEEIQDDKLEILTLKQNSIGVRISSGSIVTLVLRQS
jgi:hypothetical protein